MDFNLLIKSFINSIQSVFSLAKIVLIGNSVFQSYQIILFIIITHKLLVRHVYCEVEHAQSLYLSQDKLTFKMVGTLQDFCVANNLPHLQVTRHWFWRWKVYCISRQCFTELSVYSFCLFRRISWRNCLVTMRVILQGFTRIQTARQVWVLTHMWVTLWYFVWWFFYTPVAVCPWDDDIYKYWISTRHDEKMLVSFQVLYES